MVHPLRQKKIADCNNSKQKEVCATAFIIKVIGKKGNKQDTGRILSSQQHINDHKSSKQPEEDTTAEYHWCLRIISQHLFETAKIYING